MAKRSSRNKPPTRTVTPPACLNPRLQEPVRGWRALVPLCVVSEALLRRNLEGLLTFLFEHTLKLYWFSISAIAWVASFKYAHVSSPVLWEEGPCGSHRAAFLSGGSRESYSLLVLASRGLPHLLVYGPFLQGQPSNVSFLFCPHTTL